MVKAVLDRNTWLKKTETAFNVAKNWTKQLVREQVLEPAQKVVDTVNGQEVLKDRALDKKNTDVAAGIRSSLDGGRIKTREVQLGDIRLNF